MVEGLLPDMNRSGLSRTAHDRYRSTTHSLRLVAELEEPIRAERFGVAR